MQTQVMVMSVKDLLDALLDLQKERADFNDLDLYVTVVDHKTYEQEHAVPHLEEMTDTIIADGQAYALVPVSNYDMNVSPPKYMGEYILLRCIEEDD